EKDNRLGRDLTRHHFGHFPDHVSAYAHGSLTTLRFDYHINRLLGDIRKESITRIEIVGRAFGFQASD
ncbi:MAG: hypothetical protein M1457_09975, partial [bacterium]|nr:hypothetical protein [bacterium]